MIKNLFVAKYTFLMAFMPSLAYAKSDFAHAYAGVALLFNPGILVLVLLALFAISLIISIINALSAKPNYKTEVFLKTLGILTIASISILFCSLLIFFW